MVQRLNRGSPAPMRKDRDNCSDVCTWVFLDWHPGSPGLPALPAVQGRLLTWGWEQGPAAVVFGAVSPCVAHPLWTLTPSILAGQLSGPTGACRHRGTCLNPHDLHCAQTSIWNPSPFFWRRPYCPHPSAQGHLLSVALRAR